MSASHTGDKSIVAVESTDHAEDAPGHDAGAGAKNKRKRVADDDAGYRPKGGSSRPTKKKRKSDGAENGTPTAGSKRSRKSGGERDVVMNDD
jgi:hypothetical protein